MTTNGKSGFFAIGYVENRTSYAADIRKLYGENIDYEVLGIYVGEQWANRMETCSCWDKNLKPVDPDSRDIVYIMIDTGYACADNGDKIYGGFATQNPGCGLDARFHGVEIGTKEQILAVWKVKAGSLNNYSQIRDYQNITRVLNSMTGENYTALQWEGELQNAFGKAQEEGSLGVYSDARDNAISYFPSGYKDQSGESIWLLMEQNFNPNAARDWFNLVAVTESELLERILDQSHYHLGSMLFNNVGEGNAFLQQLAEMAMEEEWTASTENSPPYGILRSYITHTLYHLMDEDKTSEPGTPLKVDEVNGKVYFNSGLLNRLFRQIIIAGDKRKLVIDIPGLGSRTYEMIENVLPYSESEKEIASIYDGEMYKIPGIAKFFNDYREVIFDARLAIRLNDMHIFEDGVERKRLPKYDEEYQRCKDNPQEKAALLARIARDFDSAILRAKLMAERNYKLAVPQFWRETGEIQFLLPIYLGELEEADRPQCALALSLDRSGRVPYYRGATILTLDMAYNNARLIAKPDVFWLVDSVNS
ncbi:MAG: DUF3825 domain-containing protein [Anaerovoracaceae bacterium]